MTTTVRLIWAAAALGAFLWGCSALPQPGARIAEPTPLTPAVVTPSTPPTFQSAPLSGRDTSATAPARTVDRGGITGDAASLEHPDQRVRDYLAHVKEKVRSNSVYPCVKDERTQPCEFKTAKLVIEFGILKNGVLQYVELRQPAGAGLEIYDRYAAEAIKRSSPFPAMPPEVVDALQEGSTGMPVLSSIEYVAVRSTVPPPSPFGARVVMPFRAGVVTMIDGSVMVDRPQQSQLIILRTGDAVFLNDRITTGDGARIEMVLGSKVAIAMMERSRITIIEAPGRSTLDLQAGQLAFNLPGDRLRPGEAIDVRTPNAVASVSGGVRMSVETVPAARAGEAIITHVDVLDGRVSVATGAGTPRPMIHLGANDGLTITGEAAGPVRALRAVRP